jgi:hypothetical protein
MSSSATSLFLACLSPFLSAWNDDDQLITHSATYGRPQPHRGAPAPVTRARVLEQKSNVVAPFLAPIGDLGRELGHARPGDHVMEGPGLAVGHRLADGNSLTSRGGVEDGLHVPRGFGLAIAWRGYRGSKPTLRGV